MKIWTLTDNYSARIDLKAEHGLSLYIEANGKKILFDAGQSGAFAENARRMGIDLSEVDVAVLSHGHYDHSGGLLRFLEENKNAPVYVSTQAFGDFYNAGGSYIGLAPELKEHPRLIPVEAELEIAGGITLVSCRDNIPVVPVDSAGLQKKQGEILTADDFAHEQYLIIEEPGRKVVISGCSHRGILNISRWLPCDILVGGFHFMKKDPCGEEIRSAARQLLERDTAFYTCHCTGMEQYTQMKKIMGSRLRYLGAGDTLETGDRA